MNHRRRGHYVSRNAAQNYRSPVPLTRRTLWSRPLARDILQAPESGVCLRSNISERCPWCSFVAPGARAGNSCSQCVLRGHPLSFSSAPFSAELCTVCGACRFSISSHASSLRQNRLLKRDLLVPCSSSSPSPPFPTEQPGQHAQHPEPGQRRHETEQEDD